jgi:hypothetical protein
MSGILSYIFISMALILGCSVFTLVFVAIGALIFDVVADVVEDFKKRRDER